mmetsp:Transcript_26513/g.35461  ORF Transcript_26513/g.35461 Transcript_26513/m.35461 type:complete len:96 (+) Transcript_26513:145-432(+)
MMDNLSENLNRSDKEDSLSNQQHHSQASTSACFSCLEIARKLQQFVQAREVLTIRLLDLRQLNLLEYFKCQVILRNQIELLRDSNSANLPTYLQS